MHRIVTDCSVRYIIAWAAAAVIMVSIWRYVSAAATVLDISECSDDDALTLCCCCRWFCCNQSYLQAAALVASIL